ncbi:MAG: cadmium-translocating P-type ATPase [Anaerolineae bacterium]|nr:cadmium-translocating P-type ATPase [Anaerolineae bacterium]NUQ06135.1 cadmium-translocating P-type ATPase [Anaerolineae bacterium]
MSAISNVQTESPAEPASAPRWLTQAWLEPRLVVVTLAAILLSLLAESLEAPAPLVLALNVIAYAAGGIYGLKGALESLSQRRLDVDLLMILAAVGAALVDQWHEGALLLFLFSLSNVLQDYAIGRSRQAIKSLMRLYPSEAKVKRGGETVVIQISAIRPGDIILIEPGERIPVDGVVRAGRSAVDQSPITGESMPVEKGVGDKIFAGTLNQQGALDVEAQGAASDTVLARIIKLVEEAQDSKAPTERFLERFEQIYATLILVSVGVFIVVPPLLFSVDFGENFYRAMVLMTVASPCALVISTPASFISAIAAGARRGVLFKGGAYLEGLAGVKVIAFDKTGTLTRGKPVVTDVFSCCELCEDDLLATAAAVESRSEHPLAQAVVNAARARSLSLPEVADFEALSGRGIVARVGGEPVHIGSIPYLKTISPMPDRLEPDYLRLEGTGKTVIGVIRAGHCQNCGACDQGGDWMGLISLADEVRPEAKAIIDQLHADGLKVAMLTGDNARVAHMIGDHVGIDRIYADLMPEDKVAVVKQMEQEFGAAAMVGDGVNDAPALATASIGIAMGAAGTDVALETADLVLMGDRLELIPFAIHLSRKARRVVWQNIVFSIGVILMLILGAFLVNLPLPLGVLGHEGSTVIVVLNGLISLLILPEIMRRRTQRV